MKDLGKVKDKHLQESHSSGTDEVDPDEECTSPSPIQDRRKRKKKATGMELPAHTRTVKAARSVRSSYKGGKRRQHGKRECVKSYPERMTPDQDISFERWLEKCKRNDSKGENTKTKYDSLCYSLFGKAASSPDNPCK
jgi:hypothetical protein